MGDILEALRPLTALLLGGFDCSELVQLFHGSRIAALEAFHALGGIRCIGAVVFDSQSEGRYLLAVGRQNRSASLVLAPRIDRSCLALHRAILVERSTLAGSFKQCLECLSAERTDTRASAAVALRPAPMQG